MREDFALQKLLTLSERRFCIAKASHIFSAKNIGVFEILAFEILTKRKLTRSLVLNNHAQYFGITGVEM